MIKSIASPFQAPLAPGILCVILDASFDPQLQAHVEQIIDHGVGRCIPLFDDTPFARLQAAGPFAVLCTATGALMEYASALLERADAGCVAYLENEQAFEQAVEHWRSLLTISTDDTPAQLMRFYEPRWLEPLLSSLDETELLQFMGPLTDMAWRNELGWRHLANPQPNPEAETQEPGWLHLNVERQAQMDQHRLKVQAGRFALDYQALLAMPEPVAFVYWQLLAAQQAGYLQLAEQERWLRLALRQGDGFCNGSPYTELLARDDLGLGDKLSELERF
ncbi:hypothetical protein PS870_06445 [Pseudomonas fluorescens]|uniref:DUF4123 domain-containing protein n=1 Tax=Pseudomonas fluorescens TaxID=294 RepID=A0A5E7QHS2_PSEFL|nr:DUF4123 domain-containing protein [Pseudomonas fluorescens]VVP61802.1 hypothetical protein PS870_06445 [Pseudomonas fluorescens]